MSIFQNKQKWIKIRYKIRMFKFWKFIWETVRERGNAPTMQALNTNNLKKKKKHIKID